MLSVASTRPTKVSNKRNEADMGEIDELPRNLNLLPGSDIGPIVDLGNILNPIAKALLKAEPGGCLCCIGHYQPQRFNRPNLHLRVCSHSLEYSSPRPFVQDIMVY